MKKVILLLLVLTSGLLAAQSGNQYSTTNAKMATFRQAALKEMNFVRTNPRGYAERNLRMYRDEPEKYGTDNGAYADLMNRQPVGKLVLSIELNNSALFLAQYMANNDVFDHNADGRTPFQRMKAYGYNYRVAGENIGTGFCVWEDIDKNPELTAVNFVMQWILDRDVPGVGHRENIMNPAFTEMGIGAWHNDNTEAQNFAAMDLGAR